MRSTWLPVHTLRALLSDRRGATAIEYGLIIALIVVAMMVGLKAFAGNAIGMWDYVAEEVLKHTANKR